MPDLLSWLVLDFQVAKAKKSMLHSEVALARWVTQEGRGLVVVVNKMDLLKGKEQAELRNKVMKAVPEEVNNILPQVCFNEVHLDMIDIFRRPCFTILAFLVYAHGFVLLQYVRCSAILGFLVCTWFWCVLSFNMCCSAMNLIIMQGQVHHN